MGDILSQYEIDELLQEIKNMQVRPDITHIRPSEIAQITDPIELVECQEKFQQVSYLYVYPLEKLLKYISNKKDQVYYKPDYQDEPIIKRMKMLEVYLITMGYSIEQLLSMVPQTEEETEILLEAKRLGYKDPYAVPNVHRVMLAQNYIDSLTMQNNESSARSA